MDKYDIIGANYILEGETSCMNDHNLDDLIIDHIEPSRKSNVKGFLTIIALAIVVMIVAIILTKIILKEPDNDQALFEQKESEMISPDLTLQSVTEPETKMPEPIKEETATVDENQTSQATASTEEKVKENLFEETSPATQETAEQASVQTPMAEPTPAAAPQSDVETKESAIAKTVAPKVVEQKVEKPVQPKPQPVAPKVVEETVQQTPSRPANVLTRPGETTAKTSSYGGGNYYVQVGSFSKVPSQNFLNRIKSNGFNYSVVQSGGSNKLLIGPYPDRASVERALLQVRERINKNAFIYTKN